MNRPEHAAALRDASVEEGQVDAPTLVVDDSYPFVGRQDAFLDDVRRFVTASPRVRAGETIS